MTEPNSLRRVDPRDAVATALSDLSAGDTASIDGGGATVILFTTGRGTPMGFPAPPPRDRAAATRRDGIVPPRTGLGVA